MIIKVVFCEGIHDIAYIEKIMKTYEYKEYLKKVEDYPHPLNGMIKENASKTNILKGKDRTIPMSGLIKDNILILFHQMEGDSSKESVKELIKQYRMNKYALDVENPDNIEQFEFYLFYDADELGVQARLEEIKDTFDLQNDVRQGGKCSFEDDVLGAYIFHDPSDTEKKGTLEDQILRLMSKDNEKIFSDAKEFLEKNELPSERRKKYDSFKDEYKGKDRNYHLKKSVIGISGQLQFSGVHNTVIIENSDYIKKSDILADAECTAIYNLLA